MSRSRIRDTAVLERTRPSAARFGGGRPGFTPRRPAAGPPGDHHGGVHGRSASPRRRLFVLLCVFAVMFLLLGLRVVELQAVSPDRFVALGEEQTVQTQTIAADRGSIYDRNGYELALSVPLRSVFADPKFVSDARSEAAILAPVLGLDAADVEAVLSADNRFGYLARQVPDDVADEVAALELDGIYFVDEPYRFTPAGSLAAGIIGLTDIDNIGLGGLELQYEEVLSGTAGRLTIERDPSGRTIPVGQYEFTPATPGDSLVLTLDAALQFEAERVLVDHVERNVAESGVIIVMTPATGEILAMASVDRDDDGVAGVSTNNMALTTEYEPGSVMKVVTMSAGLETGAVTPESYIEVPDSISIGGATFTEYEYHGPQSWPLEDVIVKSSNTGSINIAQMVGPEGMYEYFKRFQLGEPTGLDFPSETTGYVRPVDEWWGSSIGSMPIGQGISVSPLHMIQAFNTIANDGEYVPARLVAGTVDGEGIQHLLASSDPVPVVSAETAGIVRDMLTEVVSRGTAMRARIDGYLAAGKTGTAQLPSPTGGYIWPDGRNHYMATFGGFVPAHDPQVSILVSIKDPTGDYYTGGSVAGPAFADLGEFAVKHLRIAPTDDVLAPEDTSPTPPWLLVPERPPAYTALGDPPDGRVRAEPAQPPLPPEPTTD